MVTPHIFFSSMVTHLCLVHLSRNYLTSRALPRQVGWLVGSVLYQQFHQHFSTFLLCFVIWVVRPGLPSDVCMLCPHVVLVGHHHHHHHYHHHHHQPTNQPTEREGFISQHSQGTHSCRMVGLVPCFFLGGFDWLPEFHPAHQGGSLKARAALLIWYYLRLSY